MKFSIVVPSYNQAEFLKKTLESIFSQEGNFSIECFVFDGGSTDDSIRVLEYFDKKVKNGEFKNLNYGIVFAWISKKDKGQSDAINQGMKKISGDIIAYLNSDDTYTPGTFQTVADAFERNKKKKWLIGYCNIIDTKDEPIREFIANYKNFWLRRYSYNKLLVTNFICQPAVFWQKRIIDEIGLFNEKLQYTMDYDYWLRIGKKNQPIIVMKPLANFRIHANSKGEMGFRKQFDQDLESAEKYTDNRFFIFLHWIQNGFIKFIYTLIK